MCFGKAKEVSEPAQIPVELPTRRPASQANVTRPSSARPRTSRPPTGQANVTRPSSARPKTSRPPTSQERPPSKHRRDHLHTSGESSSSVSRPGSMGRRDLKTAGERHISSRGDHHRDRQKSKFVGNEELIEDKTIIELVQEITTFIDQHTHNFYPSNNPGIKENEPELNNHQTRQAAVRRYIARTIIDSIVMDSKTRSPDLRTIANNICEDLGVYADGDRKKISAHLFEICKLGEQLREAFDSRPEPWDFGSWTRFGYIVMVPTLRRDGQEVLKSQLFKSL